MTPTALLRRLLLALPTLLGVIVVVFVLLRLVPGDPVSMMIPGEATPAEIAHLRASYGLDKPIGEQFLIYLGGVLRGDFGTSISLKQNVLGLVMGRLPATLELALTAMVLAVSAGFALALVSVLRAGSWLELAIDAVNSTTLAIPEFLWALILILLLAVLWPVLPISGRSDPTQSMRFVTQFYLLESLVRGNFALAAELAKYLVLPALALSLPLMAVITRVLKASLQEAMVQDYILFARANGFGRMPGATRRRPAQRPHPDRHRHRRALHFSRRQHGSGRADLFLSRHRQHALRGRGQPRSAAHPGRHHRLCRPLHPLEPDHRRDLSVHQSPGQTFVKLPPPRSSGI